MSAASLRTELGLVQLPSDELRLLQPDFRVIWVEIIPFKLLLPDVSLYSSYAFSYGVSFMQLLLACRDA